MFNIIPFILILTSLSVVLVIVARKFSVLANLDVDTIQAEREAQFKERIISNRIKRNYVRYQSRLTNILVPVWKQFLKLFRWSFDKLVDFKENYNKEKLEGAHVEDSISKLLNDANELFKNEEYEKAENTLIEIIGIESDNIEAFKSLGKLYLEKNELNEAIQTFSHVLKLVEKDDFDQDPLDEEIKSQIADIYFNLTQAYVKKNELEAAVESVDKALVSKPNNPRYLDTKLEISIISKDKTLAEETFSLLEKVNPENQKLPDLKVKINEME